MLKVDGCYASLEQMAEGYASFGFYLNSTNRKILYSCSWPAYTTGHIKTDYQLIAKYCNIWRNYDDIQVSDCIITSFAIPLIHRQQCCIMGSNLSMDKHRINYKLFLEKCVRRRSLSIAFLMDCTFVMASTLFQNRYSAF